MLGLCGYVFLRERESVGLGTFEIILVEISNLKSPIVQNLEFTLILISFQTETTNVCNTVSLIHFNSVSYWSFINLSMQDQPDAAEFSHYEMQR